jgi:hypothetical protein
MARIIFLSYKARVFVTLPDTVLICICKKKIAYYLYSFYSFILTLYQIDRQTFELFKIGG